MGACGWRWCSSCVLQLTIATLGGHTVAGSTGIYGFPIREAAPLAIRASYRKILIRPGGPHLPVRRRLEVYTKALKAASP